MKNVCCLLIVLLCLGKSVLAQVPRFNSFPAAPAVVFLDFDGHLVEGTSWNYTSAFYCEGANLNATQIEEVFRRVSEDYRPFNINVTTDSTLYEAAPIHQRMRLVLTVSSSWYGTAGGVAFTGSFTWGDNTPCFVFTALHKYNIKNISEAASHEIGHTLGLNHQSSYDAVCSKTAEYNPGNGGGETGWAPIMGVGYYRNVTLWHYGSNPYGCSYMQDDLSIITSAANGVGFRVDDYGSTLATATPMAFVSNRFAVDGVIERPNDADVFSFVLNGRSRLQLDAVPFNISAGFVGANVDLQVELINSSGTETVVYNPANSLRATIDTTLSAGIWYLRVLSRSNAFAPDFASLGSYSVSASVSAITLPVHKLELKGSIDNNRHKLDWQIVADEKIVSQTLEYATDGLFFQPLTAMPATVFNYSYQPLNATQRFYRLRVTFDNGRTYYSNTVSLRTNGTGARPVLMGNVVSSSLVVNSPSGFQYAICDLHGRQLTSGRLIEGQNRVALPPSAAGLYLIRFASNLEQYTEKFSKQ